MTLSDARFRTLSTGQVAWPVQRDARQDPSDDALDRCQNRLGIHTMVAALAGTWAVAISRTRVSAATPIK